MLRRNTDNWLRVDNRGSVTADQWPCICGDRWARCTRNGRKMNRPWRGNPVDVNPYSQWCAEQLPPGPQGTTTHDADSGIRRFYPGDDPYGHIVFFEVKTHGAQLSNAQEYTLEAMTLPDRMYGGVVIIMSGNTPGPINHFPVMHPEVMKPEQPVLSKSIEIEWWHPYGKAVWPPHGGTPEQDLLDLLTADFESLVAIGHVLRESSRNLSI